jgi:4-amino-4-deoxy-L-arabinose transferase-like glycosyltransferase
MNTFNAANRRVAGALGLAYMLALLLAQTQTGVTRDEGYYFKAAREYSGWFRVLVQDPKRAFTAKEIDRHWSYNHEHPVLMKVLFAASNGLFHEALGLSSEVTAMRLPGIVMSALGVALTFLLGVGLCGPAVGWLAALFLATSPRYFYHGQMACFDSAVTTMWLAVALAWLYREGHHIRLGVVFGLAIATKHNVLFFPILLLCHWLWIHRERIVGGFRAGRADGADGWVLPSIPWWVFFMGLIGPLVFLLHWPYLWPDPVGRIGWYFGFHLHHEHYPVRYFGQSLWSPPFPRGFPVVMWAVTLSLPLVVAMTGGLVQALRRLGRDLWWGDQPTDARTAFMVLNLLIPVVLIASPSVPIFGGTKHWMNALPFGCVLAAQFCLPVILRLANNRRSLIAPLIALIVVPGALSTLRAHPHGIGAYTELAGGLRGAANLGFQRQFWGGASRSLLEKINKEARQGAVIFCYLTKEDTFLAYQRDGLLRSDLRFTLQMGKAHWWFAFHQPDSDWVLSAIRMRRDSSLVAVEDLEGVPMVSLYKRKGS